MKYKYLILLNIFLFLGMNHALAEGNGPFSDGSHLPWESSRLMKEERGMNYASHWVKEGLERARNEKEDPRRAWKIYLEIQKMGPEELIEQKAGYWDTARVVAWKEMRELLERSEGVLKKSLDMEVSEVQLERLYEEAMGDFKLTPYESFMFSWYAAAHLPTQRGGSLYERMSDVLLEQGDVVRAYAYYKKILDYSFYKVTRKDFTDRISEKITELKKGYGDILEKVEKASALEGMNLSDGTRYRLVFEEFEIRETDLFLEISFPEEVIRRKIYDFEFTHLTSKKYGPLLIRDEDKILLMPQFGGAFLIFDMNGMLLEKKPLTKEIASRYGIKNINEFLFAEDDFALISKGTFKMGSPPNEEGRFDDETLHTVTLTKDFYLQRTEVTQFQWYMVMGTTPSRFRGKAYCKDDYDAELNICPNHPVEQVSWDDVQRFIQRLNELQKEYVYRLPTEAEWEYAARVSGVSEEERKKFLTPDGSLDIRESVLANTRYGFGNSEDRLEQYAWYDKNSDNQTHSVLDPRIEAIGGLYNMHGNVKEWVSDWYEEYPTGVVIDPKGPPTGSYRVYRGGGWYNRGPRYLRSADRDHDSPGYRYNGDLGFRLLRAMP